MLLQTVLCSKNNQSKFLLESDLHRQESWLKCFEDEIIASHPDTPALKNDNVHKK
jgi:hypothetical protein